MPQISPEIIYEDENILIVNKPAQLATHPGGVYEDNSLFDILKEKNETLHLINRLDFDTSGIILCAKNKQTAAKLNKLMFEKKIEKKYLAIVLGEIKKEITVNNPIAERRGTHIKWKMKIVKKNSKDARECITSFKPLQTFQKDGDFYTLVECTPLTGRQHQIRVHLSSLKHPIVGDKIYIRDKVFKYYTTHDHQLDDECLEIIKTPRMLLHSYYLKFNLDNKERKIICDMPRDFEEFIKPKTT
ncbi:RluA family pseudouridine synthase [Candidatus Woesearchaeota archaeon]|nr:RluA family pseudouridine synthase [Candidatus Woesearchaeota archaeon]